jgi:hypothetical protein
MEKIKDSALEKDNVTEPNTAKIIEETVKPTTEKVNEDTTETSEKVKISKLERFKAKFKLLIISAKKHKIRTAILSLILIALIAAPISALIILKKEPTTNIKVAENIAEEGFTTTYDYIFNPDDTTLAASNISGDKYLELINSDAIIVDYAISPNKEKIAYLIAPKDYKKKITSPNVDLTKFNDVPPVGFELYELNLKTGKNKKLWSRDSIKLSATEQQMYKKKTVIYPDSYMLGESYQYALSYPSNGEPPFYDWMPISYTYPISHVEYIDDIEGGYITESMPWDLQRELQFKTVSIIGYDENSEKLAVSKDNQISIFKDAGSETNYDLPTENCFAYISASKKLIGNIISLTYLECENYQQSGTKIYRLEDGKAWELLGGHAVENSRLDSQFVNSEFALVMSYPNYYYYAGPGGGSSTTDLLFIDLTKGTLDGLKTLEKLNFVTRVTASNPTIAFTVATSQEYGATNKYTFSQFSSESKSFTTLGEIELPSDIQDLSYDYDSKTVSFYRNYNANNESIIEYRMINLETKEEKELKTIKVSRKSVFYYKPKLVWLNI